MMTVIIQDFYQLDYCVNHKADSVEKSSDKRNEDMNAVKEDFCGVQCDGICADEGRYSCLQMCKFYNEIGNLCSHCTECFVL